VSRQHLDGAAACFFELRFSVPFALGGLWLGYLLTFCLPPVRMAPALDAFSGRTFVVFCLLAYIFRDHSLFSTDLLRLSCCGLTGF